MRLLFIQDSGINESLGIQQLSAIVKSAKHECDLILISHSQNIFEDIRDYDPDLLGFSLMTGSHHNILDWLTKIKKEFPLIPNILGGPHPTFHPEVIEKNCVDMICVGEGDGTLLELMNKMHNGDNITNIPNLHIKKDGHIFKNPVRALVKQLDALPLPDRDIYYKYNFLKNFSVKRFITSRGCPYPCSFCHNIDLLKLYKNKGKFVRKKSVGRVIKEVLLVKNKYPLKLVHFSDDNFLFDKNWVKEFSLKYKKKIGLPFNCNTRFDLIDNDIAGYLKQAGCFGTTLGVEAGSERIRNKLLKKRLTNEKIINGAKILKTHNLKILTANIIGSPTETLEEMFMTVELNQKIKADFARVLILMAFPGLEITRIAQEHGLLPNDYSVDDCDTGVREVIGNNTNKKEIKNLSTLFYLAIKYPLLWPIIKKAISLPFYKIYKPIEILSLYQEMKFHKIDFFSGFNLFLNTDSPVLQINALKSTRNFIFQGNKMLKKLKKWL